MCRRNLKNVNIFENNIERDFICIKRFRQRSSSYVIEKLCESTLTLSSRKKSIVYFLLHWKTKWIIYIYSPFLSIIDQPDSDYLSRCRLILNNNTDILTCYTMNRLVLIYNVEKSTLFNASPNILHRVVYKGGQNVDFGPIWKHQSN